MIAEETILWKGGTSQWVYFRTYVAWLLAAALLFTAATTLASPRLLSALLIPFAAMYLRWRLAKATVYEITGKGLRRTTGLLRKKVDELELYRVKNIALDQAFPLSLLGLGTITVTSSDERLPSIVLTAVPRASQATEKLRLAVKAEQGRSSVVM